MRFESLQIRFERAICYVRFDRPHVGNAINEQFVRDMHTVLDECEQAASVVVLEGGEQVFCSGADFQELSQFDARAEQRELAPEVLYELWLRLTTGPYVTISHVQGRANAGGVGFVAASDLVIADPAAEFSLSELLFGLMPACVMPFLVRRIGFQKANYLALTTLPISAEEAKQWGLVDICTPRSHVLLRQHLSRLQRVSKAAIARQKRFGSDLDRFLIEAKQQAVAANRAVFSDPQNRAAIRRYVEEGRFPWESDHQNHDA